MWLGISAVALATAVACGGAMAAPRIPPVDSLSDGVWLKGDLHLHSRHSKDSSNNPVGRMVRFAEANGIDFLAITDHDNHVGGDVAHHTWTDPEFRSDKVVLLYGAEWTTNRGHGNVFSARPYDHQSLYDVRDARDVKIGAVKRRLGVHLSANHPIGKDAFSFSYDMVGSLEVWNSVIWAKNAPSVMIWDDLLRSGRKIIGRGGSDAHHGAPETPAQATRNSPEAYANYVGTPTTWVFARARTADAVVEALTNGRVSVSANPYAPRAELTADLDGDGRTDVMMGDNARPTGMPVRFRLQLVGAAIPADAVYAVKVVKDGQPFGTFEAKGSSPVVEFTDAPAAQGRTYYRAEVEGPSTPYPQVPGAASFSKPMVALTNPLFFNFDPDF